MTDDHDPSVTDDAFGVALAAARRAAAAGPAGLFTDLDGTLAPIVRDPSSVRLQPGAADALAELAEQLAVVCVVSGRAAMDVRNLVEVPALLIAGNHGIEWLEPNAAEPVAAPHLAGVPEAMDQLLAAVPGLPGVRVDDKRLSATVHFRNAADPAAARRAILAALEDALRSGVAGETGVELREGRMSVELRPREAGDKGSAVSAAAERFGLRGLIVLGDDLTDLDMFHEAARLRDAGLLRAAIIAVGGGSEVPPQVSAAADALLDGPAAVVRLLSAVAAGAARRSPPGRPSGG
jgi:trehalose 6-phosphate phosphatase